MIKICFAGILIATSSLALVISIMNGFEQATYKKMQSIYPDIIIDTHDATIDTEKLKTLHAPMIQHTAEEQYAQALLCNPEISQTPIMLVMRGIMPDQETLVSDLQAKIINPRHSTLIDLVYDNHILLGATLAENLDLDIDDHAYILYNTQNTQGLCIKFKHAMVKVAGIFKTGIDDLDMNVAICNQHFLNQLFTDHPIDQIHIRLKNIKQEQECLELLRKNLHYDAYSWKDLYPTLLAALKIEKWAMVLILGLIILVASMNIISLINMYITQKKRDIAILLCFGMQQNSIRKIFITMSLLITSISCSLGLIIAWIIGLLLKNYFYIKLPDNIYDTDYLPVQLELHIFCAIFILTIMMCITASILATRNLHKIKIIEILKTP